MNAPSFTELARAKRHTDAIAIIDMMSLREQAQAIRATAEKLLADHRASDTPMWATPWRRDAMMDLHEIVIATCAVEDYLDGVEGFETAPADLLAAINEYAGEDITEFDALLIEPVRLGEAA